ncbi:MAG: hypothetical protein IPI29_08575 [Ignavibacteria bacterium]|nr:hypothetical protein [Ignavibacteria bacterium]
MPYFQNYNEIKLYGIHEATLNTTTIKHVEADSEFTLEGITRRNGRGVEEIVAYRAKAVLYVPHNRIENYASEIANISATLTVSTLVVKSKVQDVQDVYFNIEMMNSYLSSQGILIGAGQSKVDVETVSGRMRFRIEVEAMYTTGITSNTQAWNSLFVDMN